ncbi:MAG: biotin--[acetyl-CoA-carboxylase] ligase [candidate division WOR-3 bacterium]|nr:biotin--[acetyl-CoA-carboxylase] ligase [candidate division WOR-3 bacterium]MCX7756866.1 biotin--[acetyl-CoA-carboxylase] ligase [candidate division WOR-3 bacterium]MDW7987914.1 biotin--[acetyl-CoA-carboxylase] ligase [candidate division WOR-3 bacterium]
MKSLFLSSNLRFNKVLVYHTVSSTQDIARQLVLSKTPAQVQEVVISAYCQTHGRGRHYEFWVSEPGGLYLSVIYKRQTSIINVENFTKDLALIVKKGLEELLPYGMLEIQGINDLYLNGKKLVGILVETVSLGIFPVLPPYVYILGIGINVNQNNFPKTLTKPATSLFCEFGKKFSRYEILKSICQKLSDELS